MERVLRGAEMAEITLLPVRHHSPACAWHVRKTIQNLKPSCILIEGPNNANSLIPVMVHGDTKTPFAIYYSYHDKDKKISEKETHYKCYYPFLDYSPELAALREADRLGIKASFIDLSYGDILAASKKGQGMLRDKEKNNYSDDYLLSQNQFWEQLCEKTKLRSFDEFWEKYFELKGLEQTSEVWFSNLLTYCEMVRSNTPQEVLEGEGSLAREAYMAEQIAKAAVDYEQNGARILVITGGFHTPAIHKLLQEKGKTDTGQQIKQLEKIPVKNQGVYLLPYSMEAADALNGYASGMPYPGFYQKAWEGLEKKEVFEQAYDAAVLALLTETGHDLRRKGEQLSVYDEICALSMAQGLAALRNKPQSGAYELLDAALSSFVKGEHTLATDTPLCVLKEKMTGNARGKLCRGAEVPPIILDFEEQCKKLRIKANSTLESEVILSVFSNEKHRIVSMFFNRLLFLDAPFAWRTKGPNLQLKKDRNLIRETWKYKWSSDVSAALIDVSVYGGTIEEAARSLVKTKLDKISNVQDSMLLLSRVFEMGLEDNLIRVYERVEQEILADTDFYSITGALETLLMLEELRELYRSNLEFEALIFMAVRKLIVLLPSMTQIKDDSLTDCMKALKLIYQVTGKNDFRQDRELFFDSLRRMQKDVLLHPGLDGCIHGILYGSGVQESAEVTYACNGYLKGTKEQMMKTAVFFRGLFYTARDFVFAQPEFLQMLDAFFGEVEGNEFMELLPELRMAFAYFTPIELDRIAKQAASFHGKNKENLMQRAAIHPDWYAYGKELDHFGREHIWQMSKKY